MENMFIMNEKIGNINREIENIKKYQMEILELKSTISEQKIHHMSLIADWRWEMRVSEFKGRSTEIIWSEEEREKSLDKTNKQNTTEPWGTVEQF